MPTPQAPRYQVSTFGDPATPTEHDLLDALPCVHQRLLPDDPKQLTTTAFQLGTQLVEDLQIIQASHRWTQGLGKVPECLVHAAVGGSLE